MSRHSRLGAGLVTALLLVGGAANAATLKGRIVNGTTGGEGTAERVELMDVTRGMNALQSLENVSGSFEMLDVPDAAAAHFLLRLTYDGITSTQRIENFDDEIEVAVFESTDDLSGVRVARHHAVFTKDPDHFQVTEFFEFENASDPPRAIRAQAVPMRLAFDHDIHGAIETSVGTGTMPVRAELAETGQANVKGIDRALPPGKTRLIVRYLVHYESGGYTWDSNSLYPTAERRVLVTPTDVQVSSTGMISTESSMEGYAEWVGLAAAPGDEWSVSLSGGSTVAAATNHQGSGNANQGGGTRQNQDLVDVVARPNRLESTRWKITAGFAVFLLFATFAGLASSRRPQVVNEPDARKVSISKLADRFVAGLITREEFEKERDRLMHGKGKGGVSSGSRA